MKTFGQLMAGLIGISVVLLVVLCIVWVGALNSEATYRAQFEQQQKSNEASFDKMWKVIKEQASVAESERESFKAAFTDIMTSQKGIVGNGALASFLTQAKVDVSPDLFKQLMNTIESQRESFYRDQQKLLQIKMEHDILLTTLPSRLFLAGISRLDAKIITSSRTEKTFETGKDDETLELKK